LVQRLFDPRRKMPRYDVLVVGAGPSGSWTAQRLARAGARVAIVDGSHPREKPCGGGVTGRALELVEDALDSRVFGAVPIRGATFAHQDRVASVDLDPDERTSHPPLVVAGRQEFDAALLQAARDAGAEFMPLRAGAITREHGGWTIETRTERLAASWIVGADGTNSLVRRSVSVPFPRAELSIASGFFVHGRSSREILVAFENDPPGYLWSFPRPDHLAVGICAQADRSTSQSLLDATRRWIVRHVGEDAPMQRYSWPIPSLGAAALERERSAGPQWLLVGDAAGLVDPITREGIYFALESANLAADAILSGSRVHDTYIERVRQNIHGELVRAARLKARFYQPRFIALLMTALTRSASIRRIMADLVAGRQSYEGLRRRLLKTLEWRLMLELFGV
jgi:geranylgeranyl reductase family protein